MADRVRLRAGLELVRDSVVLAHGGESGTVLAEVDAEGYQSMVVAFDPVPASYGQKMRPGAVATVPVSWLDRLDAADCS